MRRQAAPTKPLRKPDRTKGGALMGREQIYTEQLKALGIYDPAFEPEIKALSQLERDLTRAQKAWKASSPEKSVLDPHFEVIQKLRKEILIHRESLGLTPKSLRRLKGETAAAPVSAQSTLSSLLDAIKERACE